MEKTYTIEEAKKNFKFDKRRRWFVFSGNVVYDFKYTIECCGCDGGGCHECGYCGKRVSGCPIPFINPETNNPLKVKGKNFTKIELNNRSDNE